MNVANETVTTRSQNVRLFSPIIPQLFPICFGGQLGEQWREVDV